MDRIDVPLCGSCGEVRGLNEDCRECRARLKIAIGRVRLAAYWRDLVKALRELIKWQG